MLIAAVIALPLGIGQAAPAFLDPVALAAAAGVGISSSVIPYVSDQLAMARLPRAAYALMVSLLPATATVIGIAVHQERAHRRTAQRFAPSNVSSDVDAGEGVPRIGGSEMVATGRFFAGVLACTALVAGCSAGGGSAGAPTSAAPPTSSAAAQPTSAPPVDTVGTAPSAEPAPGGVPRCTTAELTGTLGPGEGAAGSVYRTLLLTNTGSRTCELRGFPGVSYVAGDDGHQVGPAAAMSGERGPQVDLAPGKAAGAQLKMVNVQNYDEAACRPTPVKGLRVYPPGDTASLFVPMDGGLGCAGTPPGDQLAVQTVKPA